MTKKCSWYEDTFRGGFTTEDEEEGKKHRAVCIRNDLYTESLTIGKEYTITMIGRILPMSPLCRWDGDDGKKHSGHVSRFRKVVDQ